MRPAIRLDKFRQLRHASRQCLGRALQGRIEDARVFHPLAFLHLLGGRPLDGPFLVLLAEVADEVERVLVGRPGDHAVEANEALGVDGAKERRQGEGGRGLDAFEAQGHSFFFVDLFGGDFLVMGGRVLDLVGKNRRLAGGRWKGNSPPCPSADDLAQ